MLQVRDRIASDYLSPRTTRLVRAAARVLPTVMIANSQAMVGRLAPWKGQDLFLEAFAQGAPATARARIIGGAMFGEDTHEQRLRQQVAQFGITDRVE